MPKPSVQFYSSPFVDPHFPRLSHSTPLPDKRKNQYLSFISESPVSVPFVSIFDFSAHRRKCPPPRKRTVDFPRVCPPLRLPFARPRSRLREDEEPFSAATLFVSDNILANASPPPPRSPSSELDIDELVSELGHARESRFPLDR